MLAMVLRYQDEASYWRAMARDGGHAGDRAKTFAKLLQPLVERFAKLDAQQLTQDEVTRLLEDSQDVLTDVFAEDSFQEQYPQARMQRLMEVIGQALTKYVRVSLKSVDFWGGSLGSVKQATSEGAALFDTWETATNMLGSMWRGRWKGGPYDDASCKALKMRLDEAMELRSVAEELHRLLPQADHNRFRLNRLFDPFGDMQIFYTGQLQQCARVLLPGALGVRPPQESIARSPIPVMLRIIVSSPVSLSRSCAQASSWSPSGVRQ